jgi:hypothetical protein
MDDSACALGARELKLRGGPKVPVLQYITYTEGRNRYHTGNRRRRSAPGAT